MFWTSFRTALTPDQPNILVEATGHILIADFGLTNITKNPNSVQDPSLQNGHSVRWAAPEVLSRKEHSKEADIFSFGMVMIEVCYPEYTIV